MGHQANHWQTLSSKIVHQNPFYSVREDAVMKPDGSMGTYNVILGKGSVFIVALDQDQNVYLIGIYRYTNNNYSLEVPAGSTDGEDPLVAAKRELREELGFTAGSWRRLGVIHQANGIMRENDYVYLATQLIDVKQHEQLEEGIYEVRKVTLVNALLMIKAGEITDSNTIAPLTMAALELNVIRP